MTSKEKLNQLIESYDYQEVVNPNYTYAIINALTKNNKWIEYEEVAKLILFLKLCKGGEIKISGTINTAIDGYIKGANMTITIINEVFQGIILNMLNNYLLENREVLYIDKLGLTPKKFKTLHDGSKSKFKELLDEKELSCILDYEHTDIITPRNALEGMFLISLSSMLFEDITDHKKVKEYSFMYDILVLANKVNFVGNGYTGTIGKEKYDYIKNRIQAWKSFKKKQNL